tara:strand:+ start:735 stop:1022 length:288 start_codon:yes stop_codon:yes gene_type:complete
MRIINMKPVDWGKVVAVFTLITTDGIEIKNMRLVNGINGKFASGPSIKGKDDKYYNMIWIPKEIQPELNTLAIDIYDEEAKESTQQTTGDNDIPF